MNYLAAVLYIVFLEPVDHPFAIDSASGAITLSPSDMLDYETTPSYTLIVEAQVTRQGVVSIAQTTIIVAVENVLEAVRLEDTNLGEETIAENAPGDTPISNLVLQVLDENDTPLSKDINVVWSLPDSVSGLFSINQMTGVISLSPGGVLDYEDRQSYDLRAEVEVVVSSIRLMAEYPITVNVENVLEGITIVDNE